MDLERFKKSTQGIIELAMVLEQADPQHLQGLIDGIANQDPDLLNQALRKVVFFHELPLLDEPLLSEILAHTPARTLAFAIGSADPKFQAHILRHLGLKERHAYDDEIRKLTATPDPAFIIGAQKQILRIARQLESKNHFVFELADSPRFHKSQAS